MKKGKILATFGVSGSGKSTFTSTLIRLEPDRYVSVNRDKIRELLFSYTEENIKDYYLRDDLYRLEQKVTEVQDVLIKMFLKQGKRVILDNTNLRLRDIKDLMKYGVDINVLIMDVDLSVALERDSLRTRKVGSEIIEKQYNTFTANRPKLFKLREDYNKSLLNRLGLFRDPEILVYDDPHNVFLS